MHGRPALIQPPALLADAAGEYPQGRYQVRPKAAGGGWILSVNFKGKPTHHAVAKGAADGDPLTLNKRVFGDGPTTIEGVVEMLSGGAVKGWPVRLSDPVPNPAAKPKKAAGGAKPKGAKKGGTQAAKGGKGTADANKFGAEHIGRRVKVDGYEGDGTLRFVGAHHVSNLPRCGVELDQPGGKNNGTVKGCRPPHPYCPDGWQ